MDTKNRLFYIDLIKSIAIFMVVGLHSTPYTISQPNLNTWLGIHIYTAIMAASVPLFVMASGSLLLPKQESFMTFYIKRVTRILIPWIFWCLLYFIWDIWIVHHTPVTALLSYHYIIRSFLGNFWFLYMIFSLYLITPILRIIVRKITRPVLLLCILVCFLVTSILPLGLRLLHTNIQLTYPFLIQYMGFYLLGYYLNNQVVKNRKIILSLTLIGYISTIVMNYVTLSRVYNDNFFYSYLAPNVVITAVGLFLYIKNVSSFLQSKLSDKTKVIIRDISNASLGIFFIHSYIHQILFAITPGLFKFILYLHPVIGVPIVCITIFSISSIIMVLMRKVKILRFFTS